MNEESIETNFDSVFDENIDIIYEKEIEFSLEEFTSLLYNIDNNYWYSYFIDEDGEEIIVQYTMEEIKYIVVLNINGIVLDREKLR